MKFQTKLLVTLSFLLAAVGLRAQTPLPTGVKPVYPVWYISINPTTSDTTWYVWGGAPYKALKLSKNVGASTGSGGGVSFTPVSPLVLSNGNLELVSDSTHRFVHDWQISFWNNLQTGKVPYSGAGQDVDLGHHELFSGGAEIGDNKPGAYGAGVYNTSPTGNAVFLKGGSAGYHNSDFIDFNNNNIGYVDGDGTAYFKNGVLLANKPAANGISYGVGDNLLQALANHDNAIATNTAAIAGKFNSPSGTSAQLIQGDGTIVNKSSIGLSGLANDAGFLTNANLDKGAYVQQKVGLLWSDNFSRSSLGANYADSGGGTISIVGNQLHLTNTGTDLNHYVTYTAYGNINSENNTTNIPVTVTTTGGIMYITFQSNAAYNKASMQIGISSVTGKISYYYNNSIANPLSTSLNGMTIHSGDALNVKLKYVRNRMICMVTDTNTGTTNNWEYEFPFTYPQVVNAPNAYRIGIGSFGGGVFDVTGFSVTSDDTMYSDWGFYGDSITKGYMTDASVYKWVDLIAQNYNISTTVFGNGGISIQDINVNELLAAHPAHINLMIATNNLGAGESLATVESEYSAMVNGFTSAGYVLGSTLTLDLLTPSGTAGRSTTIPTFNNWVKATYPGAYLDMNTPFADASGNFTQSIDNLHPDPDASQGMYNQFVTYFNLPARYGNRGNFHAVTYNPNGGVNISTGVNKSATPNYLLNVIGSTGLGVTGASSVVHFSNVLNDGAYFNVSTGGCQYSVGASYDNNAWIVRNSSNSIFNQSTGTFQWFSDVGKTVGASYSPTERMRLTPSGLLGVGNSNPTAFVNPAASTVNVASLNIPPGLAPSSPNDGDIYNDSITHHLMCYLNGAWHQLDN